MRSFRLSQPPAGRAQTYFCPEGSGRFSSALGAFAALPVAGASGPCPPRCTLLPPAGNALPQTTRLRNTHPSNLRSRVTFSKKISIAIGERLDHPFLNNLPDFVHPHPHHCFLQGPCPDRKGDLCRGLVPMSFPRLKARVGGQRSHSS